MPQKAGRCLPQSRWSRSAATTSARPAHRLIPYVTNALRRSNAEGVCLSAQRSDPPKGPRCDLVSIAPRLTHSNRHRPGPAQPRSALAPSPVACILLDTAFDPLAVATRLDPDPVDGCAGQAPEPTNALRRVSAEGETVVAPVRPRRAMAHPGKAFASLGVKTKAPSPVPGDQ